MVVSENGDYYSCTLLVMPLPGSHTAPGAHPEAVIIPKQEYPPTTNPSLSAMVGSSIMSSSASLSGGGLGSSSSNLTAWPSRASHILGSMDSAGGQEAPPTISAQSSSSSPWHNYAGYPMAGPSNYEQAAALSASRGSNGHDSTMMGRQGRAGLLGSANPLLSSNMVISVESSDDGSSGILEEDEEIDDDDLEEERSSLAGDTSMGINEEGDPMERGSESDAAAPPPRGRQEGAPFLSFLHAIQMNQGGSMDEPGEGAGGGGGGGNRSSDRRNSGISDISQL